LRRILQTPLSFPLIEEECATALHGSLVTIVGWHDVVPIHVTHFLMNRLKELTIRADMLIVVGLEAMVANGLRTVVWAKWPRSNLKLATALVAYSHA